MHSTVDGDANQWGCCSDTQRLQLGLGAHRGGAAHSSEHSIPAPERLQWNNSGSTQKSENKNYNIKKTCSHSQCRHLHSFLILSLLLIVLLTYVPTMIPRCFHQSSLQQMWLLKIWLKNESALHMRQLGVFCVKKKWWCPCKQDTRNRVQARDSWGARQLLGRPEGESTEKA